MGLKTQLMILFFSGGLLLAVQHNGYPALEKDQILGSYGPTELKIASITHTTIKAKALLGQMACDLQRHVYLRTFDGQFLSEGTVLRLPVQKLGEDGSLVTQFPISYAGPALDGGPFFVAADGSLSQIAWAQGEKQLYLLEFSKDGKVAEKIKLESEFEPYQIAKYGGGQVLLAGLEFTSNMHKPFTGLFDVNGKLIRKLTLMGDSLIEESAAHGDQEFVSPNSPSQGNLAIEYGDIAAGNDGNIYLMRRTNPTLIYAIAGSGDVVRNLRIDPQQKEFLPVTLKADHNKLAILYESRHHAERFVLITNFKGKDQKRYSVSSTLGAGFGCYSSNRFLFITNEDGFINFHWAAVSG